MNIYEKKFSVLCCSRPNRWRRLLLLLFLLPVVPFFLLFKRPVMLFFFLFCALADDKFFFVLLAPRDAFVERPCRAALLFIAFALRIEDRLLLVLLTALRLRLLLFERPRLRGAAFLLLPRAVDDTFRTLSVVHIISIIIVVRKKDLRCTTCSLCFTYSTTSKMCTIMIDTSRSSHFDHNSWRTKKTFCFCWWCKT
jgi:hypothetical protein